MHFMGTGVVATRQYVDGLVKDCSISIASALEILQFCSFDPTLHSRRHRVLIVTALTFAAYGR